MLLSNISRSLSFVTMWYSTCAFLNYLYANPVNNISNSKNSTSRVMNVPASCEKMSFMVLWKQITTMVEAVLKPKLTAKLMG